MIVLGIPMVSLPSNLRGDSGFLEIYRPLVYMADRFPVHAYLIVPEAVPEEIAKEFTTKKVIMIRRGGGKVINAYGSPVDLSEFSIFSCRKPIDVVFTQNKLFVQYFFSALNDVRGKKLTIPVILDVLKVGLRGATHDMASGFTEMGEAAAFMFSTPVVSTEREKELALTIARRFLSPYMVQQVMDRMRILPDGFSDRVVNGERDSKKPPTIAFIGRLNYNKRFVRAVEIADYVYRSGKNVRVQVITNSTESKSLSMLKGFKIDLHVKIGKEEFLRILKDVDIVISSSVEEGYCVSMVESLAGGKIVVLPDREWAHALLKGYDYPFFYRGPSDGFALVKWLIDNLDSEKVKKVKEDMKKLYAGDEEGITSSRLFQVFQEEVTRANEWPFNPGLFKDQREIGLGVMNKVGTTINLMDVETEYLNSRRNKRIESSRGAAGLWYLYKWAVKEGYEVDDLVSMRMVKHDSSDDPV